MKSFTLSTNKFHEVVLALSEIVQNLMYKDINMQYDPIKDQVMKYIKDFPILREMFFASLDMLFLRQWYIKAQIRNKFFVHDDIRFYDAGAGFCQYSDFVLKNWKKSDVFALDLKRDFLSSYAEYARGKYPHRFDWVTEDLVTFTPDQKFNLIAAIDILEHIENDRQVLKNFYNCLEPGGTLVISTPSDLDEAARFTEEHVRPGYAPDDIKSKLIEAGFHISSFKYSYGKWGKMSWKLAMKYPLMLLEKSKASFLLLPFYYLVAYPLIYFLMKKDIATDNPYGNGLIITADKPLSAS